MGAFQTLNNRVQQWNEAVMGDSFTYDSAYSFTGVFSQVEIEYQFDEYSTRMQTADAVSTQKAQWTSAGVTPADRKTVTVGGINYSIFKVDGVNSPSEPSYTLYLKRLT